MLNDLLKAVKLALGSLGSRSQPKRRRRFIVTPDSGFGGANSRGLARRETDTESEALGEVVANRTASGIMPMHSGGRLHLGVGPGPAARNGGRGMQIL